MPSLSFIISALLILISAFIILPLLLLSRKELALECTQYSNHRNRILLRLVAVFSLIFNYLGPLLMVSIISVRTFLYREFGSIVFHKYTSTSCIFLLCSHTKSSSYFVGRILSIHIN